MTRTAPPTWARLYAGWERRLPNHPGKATLLRLLLRSALLAGGGPFPWRMRNGAVLALSPREGLSPYWTLDWTLLHRGEWEPHLERCLRGLLRPGDRAVDAGANLGYFSAVMAQAVGAEGRVWAFEPVPETFARLARARELNGFAQLEPRRLALGAERGSARIAYDPRRSGDATMHGTAPAAVEVEVAPLDELVAAGEVEPPRLLKLDVEGHELAVLRGARETIARARPAVLFELNAARSASAGWGLADAWELLLACGPYRFALVEQAGPRPLATPELELAPDAYVDVLAAPA